MTKLFYSDKPVIGLDISESGLKIMSTDINKWLVEGYGSIDLDPIKTRQSIESGTPYLADNIKALLKDKLAGSLASDYVAISIPTARSYTRTLNLPLKVENKLKDAVELEAEQYIPIPLSTLYIDYEIIERSKTDITVLMSGIAKTIVDNCVAAVEEAGLTVSLVEPSMSSVARLITRTEDGQLPSVIVDIGQNSTDIAVMDGGFIRVTGGIAIGGDMLTQAIAKKLSVPIDEARELKIQNGLSAGPRQEKIRSAIEPSLSYILTETRKVMRYYNERVNDGRKLEQLLVVGNGSNMPGIGEYFTDKLIMPARVASPWQQLDFGKLPDPSRQLLPRYITVAGLSVVDPGSIWL
ncbi:pilus assembly protein PilM [Candidatus Saccharibacteria bacterium]|nr:pilus assembly protein PilM [Candidatus Saccharibacteria bacterium]